MENEEKVENKKNGKKEFLRTIKYTLVAASAGAIQLGSYALFNEVFMWPAWLSYLISLILSVVWNFTINRKFTFKSANNVPIAMLKVALYYVVFTPLSTLWTKFFTETLLWNDWIVEIATMLINFVTEFLYQRFFVFGKSLDTAKKKEKKSTE